MGYFIETQVIFDRVYQRIDEEPIGSLLRKQRTITKLFPPFYDRVDKVADNGGVKMVDDSKGLWHFHVSSGTNPDKYYDVYLNFPNYEKQMREAVQDARIWKMDKSGVDLRKLGAKLMPILDLKISCNCPAALYWGQKYILTKRGSWYADKELRRPKIRNPKEYGALCKHMQLVLDVLPYYTVTLGNHAKKYFSKELKEAEQEFLKKTSEIQKGTEFLKKKQETENG